MNTTQSRTSPPKAISPDESIRGLTAGIAEVDGARAQGYDELSTLRAAKQTQLARRETLLTVKYGADHPRVAEVRAQQTVNLSLAQQLNVIRVQTSTPPPTVDASGYVLHGYVRNPSRQPLPALTVALYDANGAWFRDAGYGCTDENGYFIIRYAGNQKPGTNPIPGKNDPAVPTSSGEVPPAPVPGRDKPAGNPGQTSTDNSRTFEIRVYDSKQKLLYRDPTPLAASLGQVDFREIIIPDGAGTCTPPPGSTDDPPPPAPASTVTPPRVPGARPARPPVERTSPAPVPAPPVTSTPLENIKGIGHKIADKLRAGGIKDVEALEETDTKKLVELAGTDKRLTKPKSKPKPKSRAPAAARKKRKS